MSVPQRGGATAAAAYRLLLVCYPAAFRDEFAAQMEDVFREQYLEARARRGWWGVGVLWAAVVADAVLVASKERFDMFMRDLRISVRSLRRSPGFSVVAVVTLALGIGAATTIFSVVNGVLLRRLPFHEPDRLALVYLDASDRGIPRAHMSMADYLDWRAHDHAFERAAAFGTFGRRFTLSGRDEPDEVSGTFVTSDFFAILGVPPVRGRLFGADDDAPGRAPSLVISEALWRRRGSDPEIVGSTIDVNGALHTVVGVAPAHFRYPAQDTEVWAILSLTPPTRRGPYYLRGLGRLKSGVTLEQAQAQARVVPLTLRNGAPPDATILTFPIVSLQEQIVGEVRPMLWLLLASVGLLVMIAVANVANLQITRAAGRAREFATRMTVGAGRWQLARQQFTESLVVGLTAGVMGVLLAWWSVRLLRWAAPAHLPRVEEVTVDLTVLVFAVTLSIVAAMLFGLAPALAASTTQLTTWLNDGGRGATQGRLRRRFRDGLVVAQIALSCVLLVGAGLLMRSFAALQDVRTGFESGDLLSVQVSASGARYADDGVTRLFFSELLERVRALPGVQAATLSSAVPPGQGGFSENITLEGAAEGDTPIVFVPLVHPDYFRTMSIPLRAGRPFTDTDTAEGPPVTIVSEALARRYFPGQQAVGKRLKIGGRERPNTPWREIVGVVGDVRYHSLAGDAEPVFYVPHAQNTVRAMHLVIRTTQPPSALRTAIRAQITRLDGTIPVSEPRRVDDLLYESIAQPRFRTVLIGSFAVVALVLAAVGLYGVMAYGVAQRRQEIGIRIALGAQPRVVSSGILREAAALGLVGVAVGIAGALALQRMVAGFLFGVTPTDVPTFAVVVGVLAAACLLASYVPARRAARLDPTKLMGGHIS